MKNDNLKKYVELRTSLMREKQEIEQRLQQINQALGGSTQAPAAASPAPALASPAAPRAKAGRGRRGSGGGLSLREAVLQLTKERPMTKEEILDGVQRLGYRFSTNNPLNSLGVILYGKNPRFRNENGRFSPGGGSTGGTSGPRAAAPSSPKKRELSPEARERIAAAQRARWAKTKSK